MTPSQIRTELLEQHTELRRMVQGMRAGVGLAPENAPAADRGVSAIRLLADAVRRHNLREEELLRELVVKVDAWGGARAEIMTDRHAQEHAALQGALIGMSSASSALADAAIGSLLAELLDHMSREEEAFLNESVLRDDFVATDSFGG